MKSRVIGTGIAVALITAGFFGYRWISGRDAVMLRPDDQSYVAQGQQLYRTACASCHGVQLEGQANWQDRGSDGLLPAPPHDASGHTWHHPDDVLFKLTKLGVTPFAGPDYRSTMPAFGDKMSDDDILAVLSYIKSTWPSEIRRRQDAITEASRK